MLLRWLRAAVLTAVVVSFGTVAHVSADGRLPGWVGMARGNAGGAYGMTLFSG